MYKRQQLQESIVNTIPEYNHTQNVQLNVHIHNNVLEHSPEQSERIINQQRISNQSQDLADVTSASKSEKYWHSKKINFILPVIALLITILVPFLLVHSSGSGTMKVGTTCANSSENFDASDSCHLSKFPLETLEQLYGPKVKQCCSNHGYSYIQNKKCEVRF